MIVGYAMTSKPRNNHKPDIVFHEWMTLEQISEYLRLNTTVIIKMVRQHKIPASKVGDLWRFNKRLIDEWLSGKNPD